ncbi:hypothetical protein Adt_35493 [Abeliophyllum distichum]|uniref:Uncharacterized protein n=1 Tax=Abeliophyllum distichum TaxID=126358 RepID=A0ABD1QG86_9LAMI
MLTTVDSFWTHGWDDYSIKSSVGVKLSAVKALVARSLVSIKEAESSVQDLELNKTILNESKSNIRLLTDEKDKLKVNPAAAKRDVAKFSNRSDLAVQAQELDETAKHLGAESYDSKGENQQLGLEIGELKGENLKLKSETDEVVKAGVEEFRNQFEFTPDYENLQAFFVNFGARHVLSEVKELYPNLDLSTVEAD